MRLPCASAYAPVLVEYLQCGSMVKAAYFPVLSRDLEEMGYFPGLVLRNAFLGAYSRRDMSSESLPTHAQ